MSRKVTPFMAYTLRRGCRGPSAMRRARGKRVGLRLGDPECEPQGLVGDGRTGTGSGGELGGEHLVGDEGTVFPQGRSSVVGSLVPHSDAVGYVQPARLARL